MEGMDAWEVLSPWGSRWTGKDIVTDVNEEIHWDRVNADPFNRIITMRKASPT